MPARRLARNWVGLSCVVLLLVALLTLCAGQTVAQGPIVMDGVAGAGEWDPDWQVAIDPLDVYVTGTGNHPHDAPVYARSGYDATGIWARYQVDNGHWYFRIDVDGRPADSDSVTGTSANLGVGTHDVDQGPLQGDSAGIGLPEAYRLRFGFMPGDVTQQAEIANAPNALPGVIVPTSSGLAGQVVYGITFYPGVLEWEFEGQEIVPAGSAFNEMWMWAQMGDNSDIVSDDNVEEALVLALDLEVGCPEAPAVYGEEAVYPLNYAIPAAAALGPHDVVLTALVPAGTTFVSASDGGTESGGVITWELGDLLPGDAGMVTFRVLVQTASVLVNSEISCAEGLRFQDESTCPVQQPQPPPEPPTGPSEPPPVVPEAPTAILMLTGLGGLASYAALHLRARRRK